MLFLNIFLPDFQALPSTVDHVAHTWLQENSGQFGRLQPMPEMLVMVYTKRVEKLQIKLSSLIEGHQFKLP